MASVLVLTGCVGLRIRQYDHHRLTIKEETEEIALKIPSGNVHRVSEKKLKIPGKLRLARKLIGTDCFAISAKINGVQAYFIIDTGAEITVINPILAAKSNVVLHRSESKYIAELPRLFPSEEWELYKGIVDVIEIANFQIAKLPVFVSTSQVDFQLFFLRLFRKSGSLGLDVLSNFSILFDYRDDYVTFYDKAYDSHSRPSAVPFSLKRGQSETVGVFVECNICGQALEGLLDTGASGEISLPRRIWDFLELREKRFKGSIIIGGKEIEKVRFILQENAKEIVIPFNILRKLGYDLLILDFFSRKIYLEKGHKANQ